MQEMQVQSLDQILWKRKRQVTEVFLPGKSHGQRSLASYSPQGSQESDMTQGLNNNKSLLVVLTANNHLYQITEGRAEIIYIFSSKTIIQCFFENILLFSSFFQSISYLISIRSNWIIAFPIMYSRMLGRSNMIYVTLFLHRSRKKKEYNL